MAQQTLDDTLDPNAPKPQVSGKPTIAAGPVAPAPSQAGGLPGAPATPVAKAAPVPGPLGMAPQQTADPMAFLPSNANLNLQPTDQTLAPTAPTPTVTPPTAPTNANPQPTPTNVSTLPNVPTPPAPTMTTAQWDAYSPLAGLTEQQKAEWFAGKGATNLAYGATPTGSTGNPNAGGSVSTYGDTSANDAALAAAGKKDPALSAIPGNFASTLANYSGTNQAGADASNAAEFAQLKSGLNGQVGQTAAGQIPASMTPQQWGNLGTGGTASTPTPPTTSPAPTTSPTLSPSSGPTNSILPPSLASTTANLTAPTTNPTLTPLTPQNALTNSIISPSSNVNRFDVANTQLQDTINNVLKPQFDANLRDTSRYSFGAGRGVSGMNRTALGNVVTDEGNQEKQLASSFLNPALTGTIQDTLNNANFAAGQQNFEAGQQNTAFNQAVTGQQLSDQENSQSFYQNLQRLLAGSSGDPSQIQLLLAELFGGQSAQNSAAAGKLATSAVG